MTTLLEAPAPVLVPQYTPSGYNAELFYSIGHQITLVPESWNQDRYGDRVERSDVSCGTTHCVAGWAVVKTGIPVKWEPITSDCSTTSKTVDGRAIIDVATKLLGLTDDQAERLFLDYEGRDVDGNVDVDSYWDEVADITGGEINYAGYSQWRAAQLTA